MPSAARTLPAPPFDVFAVQPGADGSALLATFVLRVPGVEVDCCLLRGPHGPFATVAGDRGPAGSWRFHARLSPRIASDARDVVLGILRDEGYGESSWADAATPRERAQAVARRAVEGNGPPRAAKPHRRRSQREAPNGFFDDQERRFNNAARDLEP